MLNVDPEVKVCVRSFPLRVTSTLAAADVELPGATEGEAHLSTAGVNVGAGAGAGGAGAGGAGVGGVGVDIGALPLPAPFELELVLAALVVAEESSPPQP